MIELVTVSFSLLQNSSQYQKIPFSEIVILLEILLTMCTTNAISKRSFPHLKTKDLPTINHKSEETKKFDGVSYTSKPGEIYRS